MWIFAALLCADLSAETLPDLFHEAKQQAQNGSYQAALNALDEVDSLSQNPGLEKDRAALLPALAFYRGVCLAGLDRPAEAQSEFAIFLETQPSASLDPGRYSRKILAAFEEARKSRQAQQEPSGSEQPGTIAATYKTFHKPDGEVREDVGENWADGAVRFLLTASEKEEYQRMVDPISRSQFVEKFWRARDPKPETPENEFRDEFERRVAFADQYFVQGETRGSYTDRGTVFILLGPPTHAGEKPMKTGEDKADPAALFRYTPGQVATESQPTSRSILARGQALLRNDSVTGDGSSVQAASSNWREIWRYDRKDLPGRLPYSWVDFVFISKPGYGEGVLQRDPPSLQALDRAKASLPKP
jgi:GWxTD domain-containing protein